QVGSTFSRNENLAGTEASLARKRRRGQGVADTNARPWHKSATDTKNVAGKPATPTQAAATSGHRQSLFGPLL
ncbi:hypothetical protein, partial [Frankia sp. AgKG'84/4]|uniref:hypothetical protein n=1 Tax=Frankia sp. AgKG'84/4 TaxID=573490 RepID=UPI00202AAD4B